MGLIKLRTQILRRTRKIFVFGTLTRRCEFMRLDEHISKNSQFARGACMTNRALLCFVKLTDRY